MYEDRTLVCRDCDAEFTFTSGEQSFYAEKGFENDPVRCPSCRAAKKEQKRGRRREMYDAICADCGCETQIPFKPTNDRPVYCRDCYTSR